MLEVSTLLAATLTAAVSGLIGAPAIAAPPAAAVAVDGTSKSVKKHAFTVDDMLAMERISEAVASPDGRAIVYTLRTTDLEANKGRNDLWLITADGKTTRRLTSHADADTSARFLADGRTVLFLSTRGGSSQVWRVSIDGGEAEQVTQLPLDVNAFVPFPDGKRLLVALDVFPDAATLADTVARDQEREKSKVKARAYDSLLFRHWDTWEDGKRQHLFVWSPGNTTVDVMKGWDADAPTHPFGGVEELSISPDGKTIAFASKNVGKESAWSTNVDIWLVPADASSKPVSVTSSNKATDTGPVFSPDGKQLAYLAMSRPGYESDRQKVVVLDVATKKSRVLTEAWDRSASELAWSKDGTALFTSADHVGNHALFRIDTATGKPTLLVEKGANNGVLVLGDRIAFSQDTLHQPAELFTARLDGSDVQPLTHVNAARTAAIEWNDFEQFSFKGAGGDTVYGFVMKPAGFAPGKKFPVAMLIHGGPQGSFGNHFHYRWNPQAYAGHGYGTVFIDFHGSTGYGQSFTDAIRGDWGGAPYEDLMKGLDAALAKYPWLDASKTTALGASYGGYMINWINGHTDRFKALVCHDGNLDESLAYYDTEELWFPEWEHGGPQWEAPESYAKHSPIQFVKNMKTPTLVVHGGLDFRVVDTQGMSTFTALQRKGVESRFLHFPDENHWVLKPQNSKLWHEEVLSWLDAHTGKAPAKSAGAKTAGSKKK